MKQGILIKRVEGKNELDISIVEIDSNSTKEELNQIYELLDVDLIDVVSYKDTSIYLDDEGLLKANPKLTMILDERNQKLYGNILIFGNVDDEGNTMGVTKKVLTLISEAQILLQRSTGLQVILV